MKNILGIFTLLAMAAPLPAAGSQSAALAAARAENPGGEPGERPARLAAIPPGISLFTMTGPDNAVAVRPIADVTGDGLDEVLVGIDESNTPNVFLLDGASSGTASVVWSFMTLGGVSNGSPYGDQCLVPSSDSDGNGVQNFLLGTAWGGRSASARDGLAGAELWRFDTYQNPPSGWVYSLAEMSDTTGDGVPESAFGAGSDADRAWMVDGASSGAASVLWSWAAADAVVSVRNLGDADGDGDDDVLVAVGDTGHVAVALDGSPPTAAGAPLWSYSSGASSIFAVGVLPDVTGDGVAEALAVLWASDGSAVRCVDGATGAQVWQSTSVPEVGMMVDVLADVTGDGKDEVIVSSWENAVQVLDGATGARVWKRTVGTLNLGDVWTARALDDLNGDGFRDVVAGSFDTYVYAFSGLNGWPFWAFPTGNRVYSVHGLGDLNGDLAPEVGVATQDTTSSTVLWVLDGDAGLVLPLFADDFENGAPVGWSSQVGERSGIGTF
jgi:hypothetical protein